jgi:hypothetical protein
VALNLFSEFIGGDQSSASIASNGSFCIINNISVNAKNLKTAQVETLFHPSIAPNSPTRRVKQINSAYQRCQFDFAFALFL